MKEITWTCEQNEWWKYFLNNWIENTEMTIDEIVELHELHDNNEKLA